MRNQIAMDVDQDIDEYTSMDASIWDVEHVSNWLAAEGLEDLIGPSLVF